MSESQVPHAVRIHAKNLTVAYGDTVALRFPSLDARGRILGVIGHNGSGKSTLIKTILDLLAPKTGHIRTRFLHNGKSTRLIPERDMAYAPENGAVFEDLSVESYLRLWCSIKHGRANYYRREGSIHIERLGLAPLLSKLGRELSKGQRRRVQTAVGFLTEPRLFLFDEPFDGLDIAQSNQLADTMLQQASHMSMIVSSHRMEIIERLADLIIVLHEGEVAAVGPVEEVCYALCGGSVLISNGTSPRQHMVELLRLLKQEYESCLVNRIGSQISITGDRIDLESLRSFLTNRNNLNGFRLSAIRPSLIDAMHYHLRKNG